jgi:hypothetical protein
MHLVAQHGDAVAHVYTLNIVNVLLRAQLLPQVYSYRLLTKYKSIYDVLCRHVLHNEAHIHV